ncbi:arginine--tRNA ligase [Candidatus Pacearchaeota archaeon]|nr:arginine--tRNA ligase [Candidatus Pacearchaeota archaeon]
MDYEKNIKEALSKVLGKKEEILLEKPKNLEFGDYAFPCFSLAGTYKKNPSQIALEISEKLNKTKIKGVSKINPAGPYINFIVNKENLTNEIISEIFSKKTKIVSKNKKSKEKVMIEFSQANTHKAFHVGHIRGTSMGESLARIMENQGIAVIRANYQGDTGMHVAKWLWCYLKYHKKEKLKNDESWIANIYVDAVKKLAGDETGELQKEVNEINLKLESKKDKKLNELWKKTRLISLQALEKIYKELNTKFNVYFFENQVEKEGKDIAKMLVTKNIAKIDDKATIIDLKEQGLGVWILLRGDGSVLYSAKDLVLAMKKFEKYKVDKSIYVVADEQKLHFQQLFKTLELMKFKDIKKCKHLEFGLVRLPEGKMSSRTGDNILYSNFKKEIVEYAKEEIKKRDSKIGEKELEKRAIVIAIAAIKYSMLKQDPQKVIVFDKEESLNFEGNTGPYLLYSYARASSIIKKAKIKINLKIKLEKLEDKEINLIKKLGEFKEVTEQAYKNLDPSTIANYSFELSQSFNEFYHFYPVLTAEDKIKQQRLAIVEAFRTVLKQSLGLLGIDVLEEM